MLKFPGRGEKREIPTDITKIRGLPERRGVQTRKIKAYGIFKKKKKGVCRRKEVGPGLLGGCLVSLLSRKYGRRKINAGGEGGKKGEKHHIFSQKKGGE